MEMDISTVELFCVLRYVDQQKNGSVSDFDQKMTQAYLLQQLKRKKDHRFVLQSSLRRSLPPLRYENPLASPALTEIPTASRLLNLSSLVLSVPILLLRRF